MNGYSFLCHRHRFTGEIISHYIWLYHRFSLLTDALPVSGRRSAGRRLGHPRVESAQQGGGNKVLAAVSNGDALRPHGHSDRDKPESDGVAVKELELQFDHRQHKGLNNRAENVH